MIRPTVLQEYLDSVLKDFPEFEEIFITVNEGADQVVASTKNTDKLFYSALTNLWEDCSVISKLKLYGEDSTQTLNQCVIEHEQGNFILCGMFDTYILGFCMKKDRGILAYALDKVNLVRNAIEKQFQDTTLIQQKLQEIEEQKQQN